MALVLELGDIFAHHQIVVVVTVDDDLNLNLKDSKMQNVKYELYHCYQL